MIENKVGGAGLAVLDSGYYWVEAPFDRDHIASGKVLLCPPVMSRTITFF